MKIISQKNNSVKKKGEKNSLDYLYNSLCIVASGIIQWLYAWWINPCSAGCGHHYVAGQNYSGTKSAVGDSNYKMLDFGRKII
jgi:hypothetical protein